METESQEYKGHRIVVRAARADAPGARESVVEAEPELLIDDEPIRYGQLPDGQYFLQDYAYDWRYDLMDLARGYIDYRQTTEELRRAADRAGERGGRDGGGE
jgi:hypothetical protein